MGIASSKKSSRLYAYDDVRVGDVSGGWTCCGVGSQRLFRMPDSREDELTDTELDFAGCQIWDLKAFGKDDLQKLIENMPWKSHDISSNETNATSKSGIRTKKQQETLDHLRAEKAAHLKEVLKLARKGGPTDLIDACKLAVDKAISYDIRSVPELESVVKNAAKFMLREELQNLVFGIRHIEQSKIRGMNDDDARVVELFANGTCAYGHFRGGGLGRWKRVRAENFGSSCSCFGFLGERSGNSGGRSDDPSFAIARQEMAGTMMKDVPNPANRDPNLGDRALAENISAVENNVASVVGCRIGMGTWKVERVSGSSRGSLHVSHVVRLSFDRGHFWIFEQTENDCEERNKVVWRHGRPHKNTISFASKNDRENESYIVIDLDPSVMGMLRHEWLKWPTHDEVRLAQKNDARIYEDRHARRLGVSKATKVDSEISKTSKEENDDDGREPVGDSIDDDKDSNGAAVDLYMAVTMNDRRVFERLLDRKDFGALLQFKYGWDDTNNTAVHQAALHGNYYMMEKISKRVIKDRASRSSDLALCNKRNETPLHLAAKRLHVNVAKHIVAGILGGADMTDRLAKARFETFRDIVDCEGRTPLRIVMEHHDNAESSNVLGYCQDFIRLLNPALFWQQSLILNIRVGDEAGCIAAINMGADPNGVGDPYRPRNVYSVSVGTESGGGTDGLTGAPRPLHIAAMSDHANILQLLLVHITSAIPASAYGEKATNDLFDAVNATDYKGATPLHLAAQIGSKECCHVLLMHGAVVDARDARRETPLHYTCKHLTVDSIDIADLLLASRADPWTRNASSGENKRGDTALDLLPSPEICAERGKAIFKSRELVMDLIRQHMGIPNVDAPPPAEIATGTNVEVRLPQEDGGKSPWRRARIVKFHHANHDGGSIHAYDVKMLDTGAVVRVDTDIRVFSSDVNIYDTIDKSFTVSRIIPRGLASTNVDTPLQNQWIRAKVLAVRYERNSRAKYVLMFADSTTRVVPESTVRSRRPPNIRSIVGDEDNVERTASSNQYDDGDEGKNGREEENSFKIGEYVWTKRLRNEIVLRCGFEGCSWCISAPTKKTSHAVWASRVAQMHQHELKCHINKIAASSKRMERARAASTGKGSVMSFVLVVHQASNVDTLEKQSASNAFAEFRFVDCSKKLGSVGSILRRFETKIIKDDENPIWEQSFRADDIATRALQLQMIVWDKRFRKKACLGHALVNLSAKDARGDFVPCVGPDSHFISNDKHITLPMFRSCRLAEGTPEEALRAAVPPKWKIGTVSFSLRAASGLHEEKSSWLSSKRTD